MNPKEVELASRRAVLEALTPKTSQGCVISSYIPLSTYKCTLLGPVGALKTCSHSFPTKKLAWFPSYKAGMEASRG